MRISDWSSDVCSSDLPGHAEPVLRPGAWIARDADKAAAVEESRVAVRNEHLPENAPALARRLRILLEELIKSEEHTSELQSLMRISYAVFCLKKKKTKQSTQKHSHKAYENEQQKINKNRII